MTNDLTPETIKELRRRLGLNQAAFAVRLNAALPGLRTNQVTVSCWERGIHAPSPWAVMALERLAAESSPPRHADSP